MQTRSQEEQETHCQVSRKQSEPDSRDIHHHRGDEHHTDEQDRGNKIGQKLDIRGSFDHFSFFRKTESQMDERGRSKSVEKGVKDPKPGWPQFSHFEKKGEQQPESHSKEKKDPTRPLMGFH